MSQVYADSFHGPGWPNHLLPASQQPFPSPPPSEHGPHSFTYFPDQRQQQQQQQQPGLSLNIDGLSVQSPPSLSPINPPTAAVLAPQTPISPSTNPFAGQHIQQSPFQFDPHQPSPGQQSPSYDDHALVPPSSSSAYDRRAPGSARSSAAAGPSSAQLPRKRSFPSNAPSTSTVDEVDEQGEAAMDMGPYDDFTPYGGSTNGGSPVDGSGNTSGAEDALGASASGAQMALGMPGVGGSMNVLGKPLATNNFVTKLYQMINDPKSAHFIAWTELGTSFVVSNVGEFSRSILGSHFKHNNFSSFVRQLNMYGFHKINRTPRAQRTSTDAQTWEFSHHKFLRGRPDLLDEIKRKALEPDPAIKHRVELPGEVAAQLSAMRDENRRMHDQLASERQRVDKLVNVVGRLWDVVNKSFPGGVGQFPSDLLDQSENPNIYITSPTATTSRYPPPLSMNLSTPSLHMHSMNSPSSSPTAADFPSQLQHHQPQHQQHQPQHQHQQQQQQHHPLSRQHSFQHLPSYSSRDASQAGGTTSASTPLPGSPGSGHMDLFDDDSGGRGGVGVNGSLKRPRLDPMVSNSGPSSSANASVDSLHLMSAMSSPGTGPTSGGLPGIGKKGVSRARSDSAPLGYGHHTAHNNSHGGNNAHMVNGNAGAGGWGGAGGPMGMGVGRPRSGSGMGPRIPNIGNLTRGTGMGGAPLLAIPSVPQ